LKLTTGKSRGAQWGVTNIHGAAVPLSIGVAIQVPCPGCRIESPYPDGPIAVPIAGNRHAASLRQPFHADIGGTAFPVSIAVSIEKNIARARPVDANLANVWSASLDSTAPRVEVLPSALNVALHETLLFIVTAPSLQSASPLQPAKTEPAAGVAINFTSAPVL
jgi:hypothetical protein